MRKIDGKIGQSMAACGRKQGTAGSFVYCCLSALLVKSVGDIVEYVDGSDDAGICYPVDVSEVLTGM